MKAISFIILLSISSIALSQEYGSFIDERDGQEYKTVKIGEQVWMAENLNYTQKNVGYAYDKDSLYTAGYGRLYYGIKAKIACPPGWHLPSDIEWTTLTDFLGGDSIAGGKMKVAGTSLWAPPNTGATNESGFSALPGGDCDVYGNFGNMGGGACFWSSTESGSSGTVMWSRMLIFIKADITRENSSSFMMKSIRCVKDFK